MKVRSNGLNPLAIFGAFGAKLQKLHHSVEILARGGPLDACDILHFRRQRWLRRHGDERSAVKNKKLQEYDERDDEYESRHHRDTAARRAGANRCSSLTRRKVYAHAAGKMHPSNGAT